MEYFKLQLRIINRYFTEFGVSPIFVYLIVPFLFFHASNNLFLKTDYASILYSIFGLILIFQFGEKKKNNFLKLTFNKIEYLKIRIFENSLIICPFVFFLIFKQFYIEAILLLFVGISFALITFKNSFTLTIKTPFFKHPFEFCIGFRKTFFVFIIAYFLAFMSINVNNFNLGVFSLLLVQLTCLSYYVNPESSFYVWIYSMSPNEFIKYKFRTIIIYSTILCLPIVISLAVFFTKDIYIILGILCLSYLFILTGMLAKYAAFPDKITIREGVILAFLAWFPPILILVIPYLYIKSVKKLNTILND
jgi:hypothetical protein